MKKIFLCLFTLVAIFLCSDIMTVNAEDNKTLQSSEQTLQEPQIIQPSQTPQATNTPAPSYVTQPPYIGPLYNVSADAKKVHSGIYDYFVVDENNKLAMLVGISNYTEELVIPSEVDGYKIVQIGYASEYFKNTANTPSGSASMLYVPPWNEALSKCREVCGNNSVIKKIVIPDTVKKIGDAVFCSLNSLTEINFPSSIEYIGECSFSDCRALKNVTFNAGITTGNKAFFLDRLETMTIRGRISRYMPIDSDFNDEGPSKYGINCTVKKLILKNAPSEKYYNILASNIKAEQIIIESNVRDVEFVVGIDADRIIVKGKKTMISFNKVYVDYKYIIAEKGSKALTYARKNHVKYKAVYIPKIKNIKLSNKGNKYIYKWSPVYVTKKTYMYDDDCKSWGVVTKNTKPVYTIKAKGKTKTSRKCSYTCKKKCKVTVSINSKDYIS